MMVDVGGGMVLSAPSIRGVKGQYFLSWPPVRSFWDQRSGVPGISLSFVHVDCGSLL